MIVYTSTIDPTSSQFNNLDSTPALIQEQLQAKKHWRIVTVKGQAWSSYLAASEMPLDWRKSDEAHTSFRVGTAPSDALEGANKVANKLNLGYSSQDWIETDSGTYLVDVNPGGQWLFLPEEVSNPVSAAISKWLNRVE